MIATATEPELGTLDVLNCGAGHLKFSFDPEDPAEVKKARGVIADMLGRGYAIFIDEGGGTLKKVKKFDPEHDTYVIEEPPAEPKKKRGWFRHVPARSTRATAVAPTAGG